MKDEKTMHPYFSEWEPMGNGCNTIAAQEIVIEWKYYG